MEGIKILGIMEVEEARCLDVLEFNLVLHNILLESIKVAMVLDKNISIVDELGDELANAVNAR